MTARYTGEIPRDKVQEAFSKMELENMEVIGKRLRCTGSRLAVDNQQTRGMSGRRTMAVQKPPRLPLVNPNTLNWRHLLVMKQATMGK